MPQPWFLCKKNGFFFSIRRLWGWLWQLFCPLNQRGKRWSFPSCSPECFIGSSSSQKNTPPRLRLKKDKVRDIKIHVNVSSGKNKTVWIKKKKKVNIYAWFYFQEKDPGGSCSVQQRRLNLGVCSLCSMSPFRCASLSSDLFITPFSHLLVTCSTSIFVLVFGSAGRRRVSGRQDASLGWVSEGTERGIESKFTCW